MIGVDTNILVRYLTQDDEKQANIVNRFIAQYEHQTGSIFINNIVICELIWVLERGYKYSKKEIISVVRIILSTAEFTFEQAEILWLSLNDYEKYNTDFSDILLGKINKISGCDSTISFDSKALNLKEFDDPINILTITHKCKMSIKYIYYIYKKVKGWRILKYYPMFMI